MQEIQLFCKHCEKSFRMSFTPCGCKNDIVLKGITLKCRICTRTVKPKNYTEGQIIAGADKNSKFYI